MPFGCSGGPVLAQIKRSVSIVGMLSAGQPDRCGARPLIQALIRYGVRCSPPKAELSLSVVALGANVLTCPIPAVVA